MQRNPQKQMFCDPARIGIIVAPKRCRSPRLHLTLLHSLGLSPSLLWSGGAVSRNTRCLTIETPTFVELYVIDTARPQPNMLHRILARVRFISLSSRFTRSLPAIRDALKNYAFKSRASTPSPPRGPRRSQFESPTAKAPRAPFFCFWPLPPPGASAQWSTERVSSE